MKEKKLLKIGRYLLAALLFCLGISIFLSVPVKAKTQAYKKYTIQGVDYWKNGTNTVYLSQSTLTLYHKKNGQKTVIAKLSYEKDDPAEMRSYAVFGVYKNIVVVGAYSGQMESKVYCYDMAGKKRIQTIEKCRIMEKSGNYFVTTPEMISDSGPFQTQVYQLTAAGLKKICSLDSYACGFQVYQGDFIYGSYPSYPRDAQKNMTAFRYSPKKNRKTKLFQIKGTGDYCQVMLQMVEGDTVTATESGSNGSKTYCYNFTTGKLKKV